MPAGRVTGLRRVAVRVAATTAEQVAADLLELVPSGLEQVEHPEEVELAVYVADDDAERAVRERFPGAVTTSVASGWEDGWRDFHRPVRVGGLWIGPPWIPAPPDEPVVVIDPGRAFGTGAHPTTRLCVELLAGTARGSLLDVGCGSGVLAIAGVRLGFGPVVAVDDDPVAVAATAANAEANGVDLDARLLDATVAPLPPADVAVANVLLAPVEQILARVVAGTAVTSGYLVGDLPTHPGWSHAERVALDGWAADRFVRR